MLFYRLKVKLVESQLETLEKIDPSKKLPLHGIPFGLKDNIQAKGFLTTCGSQALKNYRAPFDATVVDRLYQAGRYFIGETKFRRVRDGEFDREFWFWSLRIIQHILDMFRGGSSGGSASAVKQGLCRFSLGTDTGGSVRLPAHYCGVYGFKPSYGEVSRYGVVAYASSLDQVGILANSAKEVDQVFQVIRGYDPKDSSMRYSATGC